MVLGYPQQFAWKALGLVMAGFELVQSPYLERASNLMEAEGWGRLRGGLGSQ